MGNLMTRSLPDHYLPTELPLVYPEEYCVYPTNRRKTPEELEMYRMNAKSLSECQAGEFPFYGDEGTAKNYRHSIGNILAKMTTLKAYYDQVYTTGLRGGKINGLIQLFCNQVNILCHHYEIFFRESSVKVDKYVEKRKQIARDGYKDLKNLSLIIYLNERRNPILFKLVRQRVKFQARQVQKLVDHFHRTFCPVLTNAIPKPNAPPMRIAASPTSAQIIPFYDDSKFGIIVD
ncbi:Mediator of RNA polymerase II transcription subunit 7 [Caenorhabditis elegans]|uniref:Mediator of RNA polymerase II transcription subunit 7 n=1 Tax=Caenorhabditis elegans TaxID=6239 RepID=Q93484_CAEEL|nr:Mediator of RNA polymerase II transcription subunit 7 [Caenorhabditis elegans]CAB02933.1 Mediator of RNA polymerase II transcription subunit 7 [Caenorhabditis elegans]|eukprot:NP_506698.1 Uncharacterized protein CELE_F14H8.4 [Caenorhabditis elegans]